MKKFISQVKYPISFDIKKVLFSMQPFQQMIECFSIRQVLFFPYMGEYFPLRVQYLIHQNLILILLMESSPQKCTSDEQKYFRI